MIFRLYFKVIEIESNDFEIESKYHRKIAVLLSIAHILSLQDVVFLRSMLFLILRKTYTSFAFGIQQHHEDTVYYTLFTLSLRRVEINLAESDSDGN